MRANEGDVTLLEALQGLPSPRLLVVGDLVLDRHVWGEVERVSPEAPVPVLRADSPDPSPGGAAAVAVLARALDARVTLAGLLGADRDGRALRRLLEEAEVGLDGVLFDPDRPTTVKERFVGRAGGRTQHLLRVDRERCAPPPPALGRQLLGAALAALEGCDAVLVADYGKGVCTQFFLEELLGEAARRGVPVLVDPARGADLGRYHGASLLAPNRAEASLVLGRDLRGTEGALEAAEELRKLAGVNAVLLKLDRDGMALVEEDGSGLLLPARPHSVCDATGAGDMVLATAGVARAGGLSWARAAGLANAAAGLQVERLAVAPLTRTELAADLRGDRPELTKLVTAEHMAYLSGVYRRAGRAVAFTNGCFDLLHAGHLRCLQEAAAHGDVLVAAVNDDRSVRRLKGPGRPVVPQAERVALLAALSCVDYVVLLEEDEPHGLLRLLRPDVLVKGGTYAPEQVAGREVVLGYGGRVAVTGRREGLSTSGLLERVRRPLSTAG